MREILFRGKHTDGHWMYGMYAAEGYQVDFPCILPHYDSADDSLNDYEVDPDTVGQYTGLTDKNGKKIFEGDIVQRLDVIQVELERGKVGFDEVCCCFYLTVNNGLGRRGIFRDAEYEVIGNIHDNPELLGEENEQVH